MITYTFAENPDAFFAQMEDSYNLLPFYPRQRRALRFLADHLASGPMTAEQVFQAFDQLQPDKTRFPPYPSKFLRKWCKEREFRRACRAFWNAKEETMINTVDANELDPLSQGIIWLLYLSFVFAMIVAIAPILPFPLEPRTVAAVIILYCFVRVMDGVIGTAFGVSARLVRRGIKLARLRKQVRVNG